MKKLNIMLNTTNHKECTKIAFYQNLALVVLVAKRKNIYFRLRFVMLNTDLKDRNSCFFWGGGDF